MVERKKVAHMDLDIEILPKLHQTKALDNKTSLVNFLIETIEATAPSVMGIVDDFALYETASKTEFKSLKEDVKGVADKIKAVDTELKLCIKLPNDHFVSAMSAFSKVANEKGKSLSDRLNHLDEETQNLALRYGIDPKEAQLDDLLALFRTFINQLKQTAIEMKKEKEREEYERKRKEELKKEKEERKKHHAQHPQQDSPPYHQQEHQETKETSADQKENKKKTGKEKRMDAVINALHKDKLEDLTELLKQRRKKLTEKHKIKKKKSNPKSKRAIFHAVQSTLSLYAEVSEQGKHDTKSNSGKSGIVKAVKQLKDKPHLPLTHSNSARNSLDRSHPPHKGDSHNNEHANPFTSSVTHSTPHDHRHTSPHVPLPLTTITSLVSTSSVKSSPTLNNSSSDVPIAPPP